MTLGIRDLSTIQLPPGWDGAELSRLSLASGITYETIVRDIDAALNAANSGLNSGYLGRMLSLTTDPTVEYRTGSTGGFKRHTERTQPDREYSDTAGHMLPVYMRDRALGWTIDALREITQPKVDADINAMVEDAINEYEKAVWTRFFQYEKDTGYMNGLGATGISAPFADAGNSTLSYAPPPRPDRMLNAFTTSHTHYLVLNGITQANLETAIGHLWEHGKDGPYDLIVSLADIASWQNTTNITGFKPNINALIQYGGLTDLALAETEFYKGVVDTKYGTARIYASGRVPTKYWGVTKVGTNGDPNNPLKVRYKADFGFGIKLVVDNLTRNPFEAAIGQFEFGVGVNSRVGAVLVENDSSGTYATPTIS